jgi:hypothetical protein
MMVQYRILYSFNAEKQNVLCGEMVSASISVKWENNRNLIDSITLLLQDTSIIHLPQFIKSNQLIAEERRGVDKK